jgi:hypothetical protein
VTGWPFWSEGSSDIAPRLDPLIVAGAGMALAAVIGAQLNPLLLLIVVLAAAGASAAGLAHGFEEQGLTAAPLLYAAGAVLFPLAAYLWREPALAGAAVALVFLAALRWVLARPSRGPVLSVGAFVLSALYVGFCSAYVVLLGRVPRGGRLILGLALMGALYHAGRWVGDTFLPGRSLVSHLSEVPTLPGAILGMAGSLAGAVALLFIAYGRFWLVPSVEVGAAVGLALTAGAAAWELLRPEGIPPDRSPVPGQVLLIVQGILLAAPALFHSLQLALR